MSTFTLKNGMKLYYEDRGSGQPVILLHGWTSDCDVYNEPISIIGDRARFITYDHRGHGRSKDASGEPVTLATLASDLNEMIEAFELTDVTLLGWSMGATVVLSYVEAYGCSRLKQIVLCDMTPKKVNDDGWNLGLYKGAYTQADSDADRNKDFATLFYEYAVHADPALGRVPKPLLKMGIRKQMKQFDESVAMSLFNSMNDTDYRGSVAKITVPLTYFYAVPGSLYPPELAEWYSSQVTVPYKAIPFEQSTHRFVTEHPKEFAAELEKLL